MAKLTSLEDKELRAQETKYLQRLNYKHIEKSIEIFNSEDPDEFYKIAKSGKAKTAFIAFNGEKYPMKAILKRAMMISEGTQDLVFALKTQEHRRVVAKLGHKLAEKPSNYISYDEKKKFWSRIRRRENQSAFRTSLFSHYGGVCCVTGCDASKALDAAHIQAWSVEENSELKNGLILRADIHRLFDSGRLSIHPETHAVHMHKSLENSYGEFQSSQLKYEIELNEIANKALVERWLNRL
ncbi:HNH endonuclease signature motif containing protein [Ahrensia kielensis]|uniref:HNH endonuclease signature motif containing protein n=1 Tax=Ahrensia kielensis TaxID=76980 RepID=A0ABU9T5M8_9HYPH